MASGVDFSTTAMKSCCARTASAAALSASASVRRADGYCRHRHEVAMTALQLHTYFRSSAAYRVRIALNLKGLDYEAIPVHLLRAGGEQHGGSFVDLNPARLVPVLSDGAITVTQSL